MYLETQLILFISDVLFGAQNEGLDEVLHPLVNHSPDDNFVLWTCLYLFLGIPFFRSHFLQEAL